MSKLDSAPPASLVPQHPIQVVARRTGLSTDVIRAWERRYEVIKPTRTSKSRRLYSDSDVSKLLLLNRATTAGRRIGDVADLDTEALAHLIATDESAAVSMPSQDSPRPNTGSVMEHFEECLEAIVQMNPAGLRAALANATNALGIPFLLEDLLQPLTHHIHDECRRGRMRLVQEILAIDLIRSYLLSVTAAGRNPAYAYNVVVATLAGQSFELTALRLAVAANSYGWNSIYLGPDIPTEEIAFAVGHTDAQAVVIGVVRQPDDHHLPNELRKLRHALPQPMALLIGGSASTSYRDVIAEIGAIQTQSLGELRLELERSRQSALAKDKIA